MCQWAQALAICCLAVASQKQQFPKLSVSYWYLGVAWLTTLHRQRVSIFFSFLLSGRLIVQDRTIFMVSINTETTITAQGICQEYTGSRALGKAWYPRHVSLIIIIFSTWFCHRNHYSLTPNRFEVLDKTNFCPALSGCGRRDFK